MTRNVGDLQVWWIPQIPMTPFEADVSTLADGVLLLETLARYDLFQLEHNVKPDFCNAGGIRVWEADNGDGEPGWSDWYDEDTGEDDPIEFLKAKAGN